MQELITLLEGIYGETIVGSDINLIKHLFFYLKFDNWEFSFQYEEQSLVAVVEDIAQDTVILNVPNFEEAGTRRARIRFEVVNVLYVFEVMIRNIDGFLITINIPTELQSAKLRKNRRLEVDDLFMNFIILFKSLRGGKTETGENISAESKFPYLMREIRKDDPDIILINRMLTDYILRVSNEFELHFFSQDDKRMGLVEEILGSKGKSIYNADCSKIENYIAQTNDPILTNYNLLFQKLKNDLDEISAKAYFEEMVKRENRDFLVSYVISPLTLFDRLIGFVKVFTTAMDKHLITMQQAVYIHELAEIVSYALTKVTIKDNRFSRFNTSTKIMDISISGLLFEIEDENLYKYMHKHNKIKMYIPIGEKNLVISAEILRYFKRGDNFYLGVNFFASNPDDLRYLENYIFEKERNILSE